MQYFEQPTFRTTLSDIAWMRFKFAATELKRTLDQATPFPFVRHIKGGKVLLVGEGNLTFSVSLARLAGTSAKNMTSTTFQSTNDYTNETARNARILTKSGARVMAGVDATKLSNWFGSTSFDLIVFQFPNVGSRFPIYGRNPNHVLLRRFLRSANEHITTHGVVAVTVVNSPHYDGAFAVDDAAERSSFCAPTAHPFYFSDYPGYSHVKTKEDGSPAFENDDEFVTLVFQTKG